MTLLTSTRYGPIETFDPSDLVSRFLGVYGEWSYIEISFLNSILSAGERILDAGAYIGTFSLGIAESQPELIVAVEPNPSAHKLLSKNLTRNLQVPFAVEKCSIGQPDGLSMVGHYAQPENFGSLTFSHQTQHGEMEATPFIKTECLSLQDIRLKYGAFSFIKLDIEGGEQEAIASDAKWISKTRPVVWAECNEDSRSIATFELLKSLGYKIFYFCYPAFNPGNFKKEKTRIFPVAFEAGMLAVPKKRKIVCPAAILATGAELKLVETTEDLRRALWFTPRWGAEGWQDLGNTQLIATRGHILKGEKFENFLTGQGEHSAREDVLQSAPPGRERTRQSGEKMHQKGNISAFLNYFMNYPGANMIKTSAKKLRQLLTTKKSSPAPAATQNQWLNCELSSLRLAELFAGAVALDKDADEIKQPKRDADVVKLRIRAIELIEASFALAQTKLDWLDNLYTKQLLLVAVASDRLAALAKSQGDAQALPHWVLGAQCLEKLYARFPKQPEWVGNLYTKQLLEGAVACDRLATAAKDRDDKQAVHHWVLGGQCIEKLFARFPGQPEWIDNLYTKHLLQGAVACDRLATPSKNQDDAQAVHHWVLGAQCLEKLYARIPDQPEWVSNLYTKQLLEGTVACDRLATAAKSQDDTQALHYWALGAQCIEKLRAHSPDQPGWVGNLYSKQVREASLARDRQAVAV